MDRVRTAVVGVGHFGSLHAAKYAAEPGVRLVAVADVDAGRAAAVAARHGAEPVTDYRRLAGRVDAVSVAVPTAVHHEVGRFFLDHGVHVLVEKPIAPSLEEADDLIRRARTGNLVLQVGHVERFFALKSGLMAAVRRPRYIEAVRTTPFAERGSDVGVVLDLMIHDIDLVVAFMRAPVTEVDAVGARVLSGYEDVVNARLVFANGAAASLTANRVALAAERRLSVFQPGRLVSVDLLARRFATIRRVAGAGRRRGRLAVEEHALADHDPLGAEIADFVAAVAGGTAPLVTGEDGREALAIGLRIVDGLRAPERRHDRVAVARDGLLRSIRPAAHRGERHAGLV